jgi:hypothetical protein
MLSTTPGRDKVKTRSGTAGALVGVALLAGMGCGPDPSSARGMAERLLDAHYVRIDLQASSKLTSGVAQQKVESEIVLTRGVEIDAATRQPRIHYRLDEERDDGDGALRFVYRLTIVPEGADRFHRQVLLTMRHTEAGWSVGNYEELPG